MHDQASKRLPQYGSSSGRLRDQPLLPLPPASSAGGPASLSTAIQTVLPPPQHDRDSPERRYVRAVLARYLWLPDTPSQSSRHDRRLAHSLCERGVPLLVVEAALLLAATRRALREPWLAPLPRVRSMHYYLPIVAEVLDNPREPDLDYLTCLLRRLRPLAELKQARLRHEAQYGCPGGADDPTRSDHPKGKGVR
jgi:hypothetical protein